MCALNCSHYKENNPWQLKSLDNQKVSEIYFGLDKDRKKDLLLMVSDLNLILKLKQLSGQL